MIEAAHVGVELAEAVEAEAAFASMDGLTQWRRAEEIEVVDAAGVGWTASVRRLRRRGADLCREQNLDEVAGLAALDQAESAAIQEAADGGTSGADGDANSAGEPGDREVETAFAFKAGVTEEERIGGAVDRIEREIGDNEIVELFPHHGRIEFFIFHVGNLQERRMPAEGAGGTALRERKNAKPRFYKEISKLTGVASRARKEKRRVVQPHSRQLLE